MFASGSTMRHLMCDEMQLKSGVYWNTQTHKLVGFASDTSDLNLLDELHALEKISDNNDKGPKKLINGI